MSVPAWFDEASYLKNKVYQLNSIAWQGKTDWTTDSFLVELAQYEATPYEHFVAQGNAENVSPNDWFNVAEYLKAKAEQMNAESYKDRTDWTEASVLEEMKSFNVTAWDHYTLVGQFEGVNPSNNFDTNAYFDAKAALLNDAAWEGRTDWTAADIQKIFKEAGINPIMDALDVSRDQNIGNPAVPADEQVQTNFNPYGDGSDVPGPDEPAVELTTGQDKLSLDDSGNVLDAVVGNSKVTTLNNNDQIDGGAGSDTLNVDMSASFNGFGADGWMKGVETVDLTNSSDKDLTFSAANIEGAQTWNINGNVSLSNLSAAGVTVNLADAASSKGLTLGFAADAVKGAADALTLGVNNVQGAKAAAVKVSAAGIENLTVNAAGENVVDLSGMAAATDLSVQGDGALKVTTVDAALENINASAATGKLDLDATAAALKSAALGSADDKLTVTNIAIDAEVDGGAGQDELVLKAPTKSTLELNMANVETLTVKGTAGNLLLAGGLTSGLETLKLDAATNDVTLAEFSNTQLNVEAVGANTGNLSITEIGDITLNVGDNDKTTTDSFSGTLTLADATALTVNVAQEGGTFNGSINGAKITDLTVNNANTTALTLTGASLDSLTDLTVSGFGAVNLAGATLGSKSDSITVDASGLKADFTASFTGNTADEAELSITGTRLGANTVTVDESFASIEVTGGILNDTIVLSSVTAASDTAPKSLTADLGLGTNILGVGNSAGSDNGDFSGWDLDLSNLQINITSGKYLIFDENISDVSAVLDGQGSLKVQGTAAAETFDLSNVTLASGAKVSIEATLGAGDTVTLGAASEKVVIDGMNVTINDFKGGATTAGGDRIDFGSDLAFSAYSALVTDASGSGITTATADSGNKSAADTLGASIYYLGNEADDAAAVANLFVSVASATGSANASLSVADKLYLATGSAALLITDSADGGSKIWYIDNTGTEGVVADEVQLVGTLDVAADTLVAGNFVA